MKHDDSCWMNAAYAMGVRMTSAFFDSGWCTTIRGAEGGGKVTNLPTHVFMSDDGDAAEQCPTEIAITARREKELSDLGFLPLCHYKNTDYAVFFGSQTTQKPKKYDRPEATENAAISARLPYIMATSRFAHYLKVMARDKIGSFMEVEDCSRWLNRWINNYVNTAEGGGQEIRAKYPLRDAAVEVTPVPGSPGSYHAVAYLRPWLQMEELTASLRLVARIPQKA
jgi:type VI secretion system protein ImpC